MILELVGALIVCAIFIPYARRVKNGNPPQGWFWNMIDTLVCFVKDDIATPGIGSHDVKRFLPFVWSIFFFVLALNLIGMIPSLGAATGSISVTAALALSVFAVVVATGMKKMGVVGFIKAQAPHLDVHPVLKAFLIPMIWAIEMFGLFIKHIVLAVRLFANMFAGHLVVGVFVAFIAVVWGFGCNCLGRYASCDFVIHCRELAGIVGGIYSSVRVCVLDFVVYRYGDTPALI